MDKAHNREETIVSREISGKVLDYLVSKHRRIISNNYRDSCGLIAIEIARILLQEGRKPCIVIIMEYIVTNGETHHKTLSPTIFEGRVEWTAHQVCCCDGMAFDPIIGEPINIEEYCTAVFGEEIQMEICISQEGIAAFVGDIS